MSPIAVQVSEGGRIVIPAEIRQKMGISVYARSQAPAWECGDRSSSFVCSSIYTINRKLELPILHSQAGAWERARRGSQL